MTTPIKVLIVNDSAADLEQLVQALDRGGYEPRFRQVDSEPALREALAEGDHQIVVADYTLASLDGLRTIALVHEFDPDLPVILVSGAMGEDLAVQAVKAGAADYILKDHPARLVPAVERELREAEARRERRHMEQALFRERERALVTLHSIGDAVITTDARGRVDYLNPQAEKLTGWALREALGRPLAEVFALFNERSHKAVSDPAKTCLRTGSVVVMDEQTLLRSRQGQEWPIEDSAAPIRSRDGSIIGVVVVFHDVSRERHMAHQISWQSTHDTLTGLLNRVAFENALAERIAQSRERRRSDVVLYVDLDQFKVINDTCGHVAGDELLREMAGLVHQDLPSGAVLARLGGDEFGILLGDCDAEQGRQAAYALLQRIHAFRYRWEQHVFEVSASIGLVPIHGMEVTPGFVMSTADVACYVAKDNGGNRVHVYQEGDIEQARRHSEMQWVARIGQAMEERRFLLCSQSILPAAARDARPRYELLLRMRDTDGSLVYPGSFIQAAERYNLMPSLDRWVIRTAFADCGRRAAEAGGAPELCSLNLSGTSLNDDQMLDFIRGEIEASRVPPASLCFEITETAAIANLNKASRFIRALRQLGCSFALDDFGIGLSSFAYLKNLPVDYLKIDGSFVRQMLQDPMDAAIVEAVNHIGHTMGMQTIAEFVEDLALLERVTELGIDYAQGFGLARCEPFPHTTG